ncbi:unnamed protein product [Triticum turgidum subsp. durum]|uniref:HTH myb-type domain-containing protein n=1 Tax=Triticum turgidum subsp. durum TaxID=4567 RepID=A0A9R1PW46_TRITD|nr:unnamed protein product [Triticum turgidum subsp. durum]
MSHGLFIVFLRTLMGFVCMQHSMDQQNGLIARSLPGHIGKQCQERWHNHLNPEYREMVGLLRNMHELIPIGYMRINGQK